MSDIWTDRLSEYIDETLPANERTALEAHVAGCAACATTLDELKRVVARAQALDDRLPGADLWPAIAQQIGVSSGTHRVVSLEQRRVRRRLSFTIPQLAAASFALAALSVTAAWLALRQPPVPPAAGVARDSVPMMRNAASYEINLRYTAAVADLERALAQRRGRLDTTTVRVIEKNLGIIDRAIRDAQSALAADPGNAYLNLHLAGQMRRKLDLLRRASALAGARS